MCRQSVIFSFGRVQVGRIAVVIGGEKARSVWTGWLREGLGWRGGEFHFTHKERNTEG